MKHIYFTIDGAPKTTAQQKGVMVRAGRAMFFKKKPIQAEEKRLTAGLFPHVPVNELSGPLAVQIHFVFPFTQVEQRRFKASAHLPKFTNPKTTKPDLDNCAKTLLDVMTKLGFWGDDSQITSLTLVKSAGFTPRIEVSVVGD